MSWMRLTNQWGRVQVTMSNRGRLGRLMLIASVPRERVVHIYMTHIPPLYPYLVGTVTHDDFNHAISSCTHCSRPWCTGTNGVFTWTMSSSHLVYLAHPSISHKMRAGEWTLWPSQFSSQADIEHNKVVVVFTFCKIQKEAVAHSGTIWKNRVWTLSLQKLRHVYIWWSVNWVNVGAC